MKKLFFIAYLIACTNIATVLISAQTESSVEQLVRIMMSGTNTKDVPAALLAKKRSPDDYQDVYDLVTKHPKLLKGIIHDHRTFAMLCVQRGYSDLLACLIKKGLPVDLATPCNLIGLDEPQTTVLHILLSEVWKLRKFNCYSEEYTACITKLTKLIIKKYPELLDMPVYRSRTAGMHAHGRGLFDLISA